MATQLDGIRDGSFTDALQQYQRVRTEQTAEIQRAARGYAKRRATIVTRLADIVGG